MTTQADMFPCVRVEIEEVPNERYTPRHVFDPLHRELRFTLDVCATAESAKLPRYFTRADDGLKQSWAGERAWCNPPYDDIESWVKKAWAEMHDTCSLVACLVPAWTDRAWWEMYVEPYRDGRSALSEGVTLQTRFLPGRIRFGHPGNPEGIGSGSPPFWCVLLVWSRL